MPLFPLPSVVLFPRAVLPLHIFEERYKQMTADALAGHRHIAVALLKPGWEKNYYATPEVEPVLCIGRILTHEKLPDGKYNFLLEGRTRARIIRERSRSAGRLYRTATLEPLEQSPVMEIDLCEQRQKMLELFETGVLSRIGLGRQFRQMLCGAVPVSTADVADLAAFYLLDDAATKQKLLADADVRRRVEQTIAALQRLVPPAAQPAEMVSAAQLEYSRIHPDLN